MKTLKERKNKHFQFHLLIFFVLMSLFLLNAYQAGINAAGKKDTAGDVSAKIPQATCQNQYTCSYCSQCSCGSWAEVSISPTYGTTQDMTYYVCQMASYSPQGTGSLEVGSKVLGYCPTTQLSSWNTQCNIWTQ